MLMNHYFLFSALQALFPGKEGAYVNVNLYFQAVISISHKMEVNTTASHELRDVINLPQIFREKVFS